MASINKLSIRGLRSFSHERDQVIEFYTPLTMIVGANGCGKTTVIECLKYACTGALPPGARNGQSFVHDPKVSGTNEVKANIKLRFAGRDGRVSVVIRSFQLTQKRVTLQFKALDGVIRTKDDNGNSVSITHKCTELDKHIPLCLGVSKAILENVVFCHQEDASWPLQEGAVVKKKFDDIFESARYTKALEAIKKTKQEYAVAVKDLKIVLVGLQERLHAAEALNSELNESQEKFDDISKEVEEIDARNRELSVTLSELQDVADQVNILRAQKHSLQLMCRDLGVRMGEKRDNIGDEALSTESDKTLEKNLREFDEKLDRMADEIKFYKDESDKCTMRATAAKTEKDALQREEGNLQAQLTYQEGVVAERDSMMKGLSDRYDIFHPASASEPPSSGSPRRYTSENISSFKSALEAALSDARATLTDARTEAQKEADTMNAEMNSLKLEERSSSNAVCAKERELHKIQGESMSLAQGGSSSQSQLGTATVSKLERELKAAERAQEKATKECNDFFAGDRTVEITRESKALEIRLGHVRASVEEEEAMVKTLSTQQEEQSQISVKTTQIVDDESRLEERVRETTTFDRILASPLQAVTETALGAACAEIKEKVEAKEEDRAEKATAVMNLTRELTEQSTNLRNTKCELARVRRRLGELSGVVDVVREEAAKMYMIKNKPLPKADPEKNFDEILDHWKNSEAAQKRKTHSTNFNRSMIKQLLEAAKHDGACPSCTRAMNAEEHAEFNRVQVEMLDSAANSPHLEESKVKRQAALESIERLQSIAQKWRDWSRLSTRPEELEFELALHEQEASAKQEELETEKKEEKALRESRQELESALVEAERCCEEANRIQTVRYEVQQIQAKLQRYGQNSGSLSDAQERLRGLTSEKDKITTDLQVKGKEVMALGNKKYTVTTAKSMRESDFEKAKKLLEAKKEFDKKKEAFREHERILASELKDLKAKEQPLKQQLQEKNNQHNRARKQTAASMDQLYAKAQGCQLDHKAFLRSEREVVVGASKKLPEALASIRNRLRGSENTVRENEELCKENEKNMTGKVLLSDKQGQAKKVLRDNIEYRGHKRELKERRKEVTDIEEQIAETDSQDAQTRISEVNREMQKKSQKHALLTGRLHGMRDQIRGFENKLSSDTYKNIEEKHRRKMIEHRTTEMAVTDLDKYWTALDKALLRFHTMKIADINKIIRELWAMTYSGEDIDVIEIVSGDDEDAGKAKRSYNYRVVMRKNDATLDMKGRCSAGQRVLASVVIRLALAETFCVTCGILALDEPTTNLDHNNKIGLAHALAKIISSRSKQSNFQLITITHDEEFLHTMRTELATQGGFSMPEFYWKISREEMSRGKFYSRIDRLEWEDM